MCLLNWGLVWILCFGLQNGAVKILWQVCSLIYTRLISTSILMLEIWESSVNRCDSGMFIWTSSIEAHKICFSCWRVRGSKLDVGWSDRVVWINADDESFSVKDCYVKLMQENDITRKALKLAWETKVPDIFKTFCWRLFQNKLPTKLERHP